MTEKLNTEVHVYFKLVGVWGTYFFLFITDCMMFERTAVVDLFSERKGNAVSDFENCR